MNCERFEMLLADALGDELAATDRAAFENHLAECDKCRSEYESLQQPLRAMRDLPGPEHVTVVRKGDRLVIQSERTRSPFAARWLSSGVMRYAAVIGFAFFAGYVFHAVTAETERASNERGSGFVEHGSPPSLIRDGFEQRLVAVHMRGPARSGLAKCLMAMARVSK